MTFPVNLSERVTALESHSFRQDAAVRLAQDGLALLSEDGRALRSEVAEFRAETAARLDRHEALLTAIARQLGVDVPGDAPPPA